jgi:hypothetical protein
LGAFAREVGAEFGDAIRVFDADLGVAAAVRVRDDGQAYLVAAGLGEFADEDGARGAGLAFVVMVIAVADEAAVRGALLPVARAFGGVVVTVTPGRDSGDLPAPWPLGVSFEEACSRTWPSATRRSRRAA